MTLTLKRPEPDTTRLKALAASGSSGLAKKAQADLKARTHAELAKAVAR